MSRNPIAKALPVHRHQIIADKREKTLRELYNEALKEGIKPDEQELLDRLS